MGRQPPKNLTVEGSVDDGKRRTAVLEVDVSPPKGLIRGRV